MTHLPNFRFPPLSLCSVGGQGVTMIPNCAAAISSTGTNQKSENQRHAKRHQSLGFCCSAKNVRSEEAPTMQKYDTYPSPHTQSTRHERPLVLLGIPSLFQTLPWKTSTHGKADGRMGPRCRTAREAPGRGESVVGPPSSCGCSFCVLLLVDSSSAQFLRRTR